MILFRFSALIISFVLFIQPALVYCTETAPLQTAERKITDSNALIPEELGTCVSGNANPHADRTVHIIIDAHQNVSAQYNIANILRWLQETTPLNAVYLEGAEGSLHTCDYFDIFKDPDITKTTADYLLNKGFITGAEYFCLTSKKHADLKGAEVSADYYDNLDTLKELKLVNTEQPISDMLAMFSNLLLSGTPDALNNLDARYCSVVLDGTGLNEFVHELTSTFSLQIRKYPHDYPLLSSLSIINTHNARVVKSVLSALNGLKASEEEKNSISELQKEILIHGGTYQNIHATCAILERYPDSVPQKTSEIVHSYRDSLGYMSSISSEDFYIQILDSYKRLHLSVNGKTDLFALRDSLLGLYKGSKVSLSPRECGYFSLDTIDVSDYLQTALQNEVSSEKISGLVSEEVLEKVEDTRLKICAFYDSVEKRNQSIVNTVLNGLQEDKAAALIVGGYHKGIYDALRQYGINVSVLMPNLSVDSTHARDVAYTDYISGTLSELEKLIYYSWSTIIAPLLSQSMGNFTNRSTAVAAAAARQIALMMGTGLYVHDNLKAGVPPEEINEQVSLILDQNSGMNAELTEAFLTLPGTETPPKWPQLLNYTPIANNNGIFIVFQLGQTKIGISLVQDGNTLTASEQASIADKLSSRPMTDTIEFSNTRYTYTITALSDVPERLFTSGEERLLEARLKDSWAIQVPFTEHEARQFLASTKTIPFDPSMNTLYSASVLELETRLEGISLALQNIPPDPTTKYDGFFDDFFEILQNIEAASAQSAEPQEYLTVEMPGYDQPVRLYLVPKTNLELIGQQALTIFRDNHTEIYLPADFLNPAHLSIFLQILKYQIDVQLFGENHLLVTLYEALLNNAPSQREPGSVSDRMMYIFRNTAHLFNMTTSPDQLEAVRKMVTKNLDQHIDVLSFIDSTPDISFIHKQYVRILAEQINMQALFLGIRLDERIADAGGTLRGFKFIRKISEGGWGSVHLAEKDNKQWAVKFYRIPGDRAIDSILAGMLMFQREMLHTNLMYQDVYDGQTGNFARAETPFIAMPYEDGNTLAYCEQNPPSSEEEALNIAIGVVSELMRAEEKGLLHNDIKLNNLFRISGTNRFRLLDFGSSIYLKEPPQEMNEIRIGTTEKYASPELKSFLSAMSVFVSTSDFLISHDLEDINESLTPLLEDMIKSYLRLSPDKALFDHLQNTVLPAINRKLINGEFKTAQEISDELETAFTQYLFSTLDIRSDIYSFGVVLNDVIAGIDSPFLSSIVQNVQADKDRRFRSFKDIYNQLTAYHKTHYDPLSIIALPNVSLFPQAGAADEFAIRNKILNWQAVSFTSDLAHEVSGFLANYNAGLDDVKQQVKAELGHTQDQDSAALERFRQILISMEDALDKVKKNQTSLSLPIPGDTRELVITLVTDTALAGTGQNAVTVAGNKQVLVFLPARYLVSGQREAFFQIFKQQLDQRVFGFTYPQSMLYAALLNSGVKRQLGNIGEDIIVSLQHHILEARKTKNLAELYRIDRFLKSIPNFESLLKNEIALSSELSEPEKEYATLWAHNLSKEAIDLAIEIEVDIAELGGEIRGFRFLKRINSGRWGVVFLAEKNGSLWAVKMVNPSEDFQLAKYIHIKDIMLTSVAYEDVNTQDTGSFSRGENVMIAVPFIEGNTLAEIDIDSMGMTERIELALKILKEYIRLEDYGIVYNDTKPDNIFIPKDPNRDVRIIDFGCSMRAGSAAPRCEEVTVGATLPYITPEFDMFRQALDSFENEVQFLRATPREELQDDFLDRIENIMLRVLNISTKPDQYAKLNFEIFPEVKDRAFNDPSVTTDDLIKMFEKEVIRFLYSILDTRSDIYAVAYMLHETLFKDVMTPEIKSIINKGMQGERGLRFQSFNTFYYTLNNYRKTLSVPAGGNVAFGTIDERDHRRHGGLNAIIRNGFNEKTKPQQWQAPRSTAKDMIRAITYADISSQENLKGFLERNGITTEQQWRSFTVSLFDKMDEMAVFELSSPSLLFWVGNRFAAAHFGRYENRDNMYIPADFAALLSDNEKAYILTHELLHLAGFTHDEAESLQTMFIEDAEQYTLLKQFVYVVTEFDQKPALGQISEAEVKRFVNIMAPVIKRALETKKQIDIEQAMNVLESRSFRPSFAEQALANLNNALRQTASTDEADALLNKSQRIRRYISPNEFNRLIERLSSPNIFLRFEAIDLLAASGTEGLPYIKTALKSSDSTTKINALYAASLRDELIIMPSVIPLLKDPSLQVREMAMETVISLARPEHKDFFQELLQNTVNETELLTALKALTKIGIEINLDTPFYLTHRSEAVRDYAGEQLALRGIDRSQNLVTATTTWNAINSLARIETTTAFKSAFEDLQIMGDQAVPFLEQALKVPDNNIVFWSALLLAERDNLSALRPLLEASYRQGDTKKKLAEQALQRAVYVEPLIQVLQSENTIYSEEAAVILGLNKEASALPLLNEVIINENLKYSLPVRQAALTAAGHISGANLIPDIGTIVLTLREKDERSFDDRVILLEIAHLVRELGSKAGAPILRELLWETSPSLKKAAIAGLGEIGNHTDIERINTIAQIYPDMRSTAETALSRLNTFWNKMLTHIHFFVAGYPPPEFTTYDELIHKGLYSGAEEIIRYGRYDTIPVEVTVNGVKSVVKFRVDQDFFSPDLIASLTQERIKNMLKAILESNPAMAVNLNGKTITLAMLTRSFRLSENHLADNFIGFNMSLTHISDPKAFEVLFRALLTHELKHEAKIAPRGAMPLLQWENDEFRDTLLGILNEFSHHYEMQYFVSAVQPAFAPTSFMLDVLSDSAHGKINQHDIATLSNVIVYQKYEDMHEAFAHAVDESRQLMSSLSGNGLRLRLNDMGMLTQDINRLISLHNSAPVPAGLEVVAGMNNPKIETVFLEEYARQLISGLVNHTDAGILAERLSAEINARYDTTTAQALRKSAYDAAHAIWGIKSTDTKTVTKRLVTDYLYSRFTGRTVHSSFIGIAPHLDSVIAQDPVLSSLNFNSDALPGTKQQRDDQRSFIMVMQAMAQSYNIPVTITEETTSSIPAPNGIRLQLNAVSLIDESL
ncbi:MAG: hypothetical protein C4541_02905 [Candidatus Auribacter fodinae]|jgi:serine/threonine protein kinase|uniref:non-specific serine/threonine protein kinase n=1 Tax=Candidatus Auribacter fodinae TaxID=2093366 RepID=A0A3A4RE77_9BACT|nr:MAG: hypothetical protein C4541_02905 [Candidatus Auribacter fodinae]